VLGLVSPSSSIDWLCLPRFDSPSVFARLLDERIGGTFRFLAHDGTPLRGRMAYVANTNVVRTVFEDESSAWELIDFAPRVPEGLGVRVPIAVVRLLRPLRGQPVLRVEFDPRPDYARAKPEFQETARGVEVLGAARPIEVVTNAAVPYLLAGRPFVLQAPLFFQLAWGNAGDAPVTLTRVLQELEATIAGWRAWAKSCALPSFASSWVLRSALCLKLHAYHDTGAIIAAATTSIPEAMGTERTWDYRYCWLRDSAFVVEALRRIGQLNEGEQLIRYLRDVVAGGRLQPLYGIGGERELEEVPLPHLAGFGGNGHVRIGNAAYLQSQHDVMGELVLCFETLLRDPRIVHEDPDALLPLIEDLVEQAIRAAPIPDTGIWEFRTRLRPYTFSRAMCWAAMHRGALVARRLGRMDLASRWEAMERAELATVLDRAYSPRLGFFTQALDGEHPDASNLLLPSIGAIDARDPRFVATLRAYEERLVENGMMLRYRNADDFGETTSAFTICSFWWAEALALTGRIEDAIAVFDRLVAHANPVGLFSEDIEPHSGRLLGNFPQAYTHVGLIHAATTIGELMDARDGRVRAWT
jgi:GH15 family glucan-1,4-alpha-glucosidase